MQLMDYNVYVMERNESVKYILMAALFLFTIGYIFFNSILLGLIISCGCFYYPRYKSKELIKKRKAELNLQFQDLLYALSSSLSVGKSLENAFKSAFTDLRILYPEANTYIIREVEFICRQIELNQPIESILLNFGYRSGVDDILNFAEVIAICKNTGGNLVQVVKNTANIISDKIEISQDIELILTKQKFEQKILNVMPIVFIGLIKFGGSGYMDNLYTSASGYLMMGIALAILAAAQVVSKKIFEIRV